MATREQNNASADERKWSSAFAYVRARNDWRIAYDLHKDIFHPEVQRLWIALLKAQKEYKRMAKK